MEKSIQEIVAWLGAIVHEGAHLRLDSRAVRPGDVFVAIPGAKSDGRTFIRVAAARGAAGVLMHAREGVSNAEHYPVPTLSVEHLAERLGDVATAFYGAPSDRMTGIAVTGTNGKTTTTHWIADLLTKAGLDCAVMGTVGCRFAGRAFEMPALTTPDAISLQGVYADILAAGAKAFAVEASSIGLEQGRMTGSRFDTAVFTNLTRDHLDYHGTMDAYANAKRMLFGWPSLRVAVINADDYYGSHAFKMIYDYLTTHEDDNKYRYTMVGYVLENTLTENGHVARGVCVTDENGYLEKINERTRIEKHEGGAAYTEDDGATWITIPEGSTVSMNMWGFTESILGELKDRFANFLNENLEKNPLKCEYFLPFVVDELLKEDKATVQVLTSLDKWYGVTYKEDKPVVVAAIQALKDQGLYPEKLWEEK